MKKFSLICTLLLMHCLTIQSQSWNWLTTDGSPNDDAGKHLAIDVNHNSAVTGVFDDTIFSGVNMLVSRGQDDVYIAKYDSLGNLLWTRSGGGLGDDGAYSMGITYDMSGNIYVLCQVVDNVIFPPDTLQGTGGSIILLKYDGNGNHIFSKIFGGNSTDYATDINIDAHNNVFATGAFTGTISFDTIVLSGSGSHNIFLAKFDSSGNAIWAQKAGGSSYDNGGGITFDIYDNIYLTGYYTGYSTFDTISVYGSGGDDCFIAKYNSTGNILWVHTGRGPGFYDAGNRIGIDSQNNIFVVGQFSDTFNIGNQTLISNGGLDVFAAKLDPQGFFFWAKSYGGPGDDIAFDMKALVEGSHFVTGQFSGTSNFGGHILTSSGGTDIFVYFSDYYGNIQWAKQTGGIGNDAGRGIDADNLAECFVTGSYSGTVAFDLLNSTSVGNSDVFTGRIFDITSGLHLPHSTGQLIVYPNPVTDKLHFKKYESSFNYRLTDVYGALVMQGVVSPGIDLELTNLANGIYFFYTDEGTYQIIKQ